VNVRLVEWGAVERPLATVRFLELMDTEKPPGQPVQNLAPEQPRPECHGYPPLKPENNRLVPRCDTCDGVGYVRREPDGGQPSLV